jgi:hypothetical protein
MTSEWIAETFFDCLPAQGASYALCVRLGLPNFMPAEGELHAYARCSVSMSPMPEERSIAGENKFQALCLALHFIRKTTKQQQLGALLPCAVIDDCKAVGRRSRPSRGRILNRSRQLGSNADR